MTVPETDDLVESASGLIGHIPVKNLWLLMLYASDLLRTGGEGSLGIEKDLDDLPDLVAELLVREVERRYRRQFTPGYRSREGVLDRIRGQIDLVGTESRQLLARGKVACRFEELTIDTPRNRLIRAALERVSRLVRRQDLARRCRLLASALRTGGVGDQVPSRAQMARERFGRHDAADRFMVAAARLAFDMALPTELDGALVMRRPDREETWVRRLFEKAIGGFYATVLPADTWRVRTGVVQGWAIEELSPGMAAILPRMQTDVIVDHLPTSRRLVIDTKFTAIVTRGRHRERTLRSGYLYQMYAYLHSQHGRGDPLADGARGLLLHPSAGTALDERVVIQGHSIRFATVDLTGSAADIRARLLELIDWQA